jgi:hypothetical protein
VSVEGSVFGTDGFPIVAAAERGAVDTKAAVDYHNLNGSSTIGPPIG